MNELAADQRNVREHMQTTRNLIEELSQRLHRLTWPRLSATVQLAHGRALCKTNPARA